MNTSAITIETLVQAPIEKVWKSWTDPLHIVKWCHASPDWHAPHATNDLRTGGSFTTRMEAKDGSMGFDFGGVYDDVKVLEHVAYTIGDGRKVDIRFTPENNATRVTETFDPENMNPIEMQRAGWQSILDNFKTYTESNL
ncbi:MAG: SRPBCC family protein [Bacteroidetes bacterium]|nr:SRPBCC family protein [Bacteroidota bacterium]